MRLTILKSKIHNAIVTAANLDYEGSVSIDRAIMDEANIIPNEQVHIWNVSNGHRIITYAIPSDLQGEICVNGAGAHHFSAGERVIIATFCEMDVWKAQEYSPTILIMEGYNSVLEKRE